MDLFIISIEDKNKRNIILAEQKLQKQRLADFKVESLFISRREVANKHFTAENCVIDTSTPPRY